MCNCTKPGNGIGYANNRMVCSDGSVEYCSSNEECYSTKPFAYVELYDGCRIPGNYLVIQKPSFSFESITKFFKVSFYKVIIISLFVDCHDLMPKDCSFFANADAYGCDTDFPKWFGVSGKIKDYCRASCRVCDSDGKYLIL